MIKVVKFGGTSLATAEQFKKTYNIIKAQKERRYVVPSAPGRRFDGDEKVTDLLYRAYEIAINNKDYSEIFNRIKIRYVDIINGLSLDLNLDDEFKKIEEDFSQKKGKDYAASRGEYLNALIMAKYLGYEFVDASEVVCFDENSKFLAEETNEKIKRCLKNKEQAVIPGFYGAKPNKEIVTFSRGGSDITGALVARAVSADIYENWTDVSGCMLANPQIICDAKVIEELTYRELRELAYMGANVLHEDSIFPVKKAGIPINILNTNDPTSKGTLIVAESNKTMPYIITGVAGKKDMVVINIEKTMMNTEVGFCRKVLQVFENHHISIEHMPSGIDNLSILVQNVNFEGKEEQVVKEIKDAVNPDYIEIEKEVALVVVVGRCMKNKIGIASKVFTALANAGINIKILDQVSFEFNIIIGVKNSDFEATIKAIYDSFVENK